MSAKAGGTVGEQFDVMDADRDGLISFSELFAHAEITAGEAVPPADAAVEGAKKQAEVEEAAAKRKEEAATREAERLAAEEKRKVEGEAAAAAAAAQAAEMAQRLAEQERVFTQRSEELEAQAAALAQKQATLDQQAADAAAAKVKAEQEAASLALVRKLQQEENAAAGAAGMQPEPEPAPGTPSLPEPEPDAAGPQPLDLAALKRDAIARGCTMAQLRGKTAAEIQSLIVAAGGRPHGAEILVSGAGQALANGYYRRNGFWNARPAWLHVENAGVQICLCVEWGESGAESVWRLGKGTSSVCLGTPRGVEFTWYFHVVLSRGTFGQATQPPSAGWETDTMEYAGGAESGKSPASSLKFL